ncbi:hypothetical protein LTR85_003754 [Meristemomyces frigidus]|nr:hypothetical protein LTR85_003754 [Meristemomyces frigidus]
MATPAYDIQPSPFPAASKSSSGMANGLLTTVSTVSFADRLLTTISQAGKLAHWVHVPLATASADPMNPGGISSSTHYHDAVNDEDTESALLPRRDLTATTVLGGTKREDEVVGQMLATTIASAVLMKRPGEERLLVVGVGLQDASEMGRAGFEEIVGLVLDCL